MLNTQVDVQSEVLAEYASTRVTVAAEVGSIHISSASAVQHHLMLSVLTSVVGFDECSHGIVKKPLSGENVWHVCSYGPSWGAMGR